MNLGELNWHDAAQNRDKVVILPLGSLEQHGHHLPMLTDSMIGSEIVVRATSELESEALFLPMLWLGHSPHHLAFPGSVSLSSKTYITVLEDILESLIKGGFRRILAFNSHGGNMAPASVALSNVQMRHAVALPDLWLALTNWFSLVQSDDLEKAEVKQSKISHACEWETSQILALHPKLVGSSRPAARFDIGSKFWSPDYSRLSRIEVARRIDQNSASGAFGFPELASKEKGEALFNCAARELVVLVREISAWPSTLTI